MTSETMPYSNDSLLNKLAAATDGLLQRDTPSQPQPTPNRRPPSTRLAAALATATSSLLMGSGAWATETPAQPGSWDIDSAVLFYSETDRVTAIEPVTSITRYFANDKALNFKLVVDSLTGASPTGAVPSSEAQTYTRPSGRGSYTTSANETPLDDTFLDTRVAISGGWSQPLTDNIRGSFGLSASNEYDYLSLGANAGAVFDFNKKNSSLSLNLAFASDTIEPEGGIPLEGSCMIGASAASGCTETSFDDTRRTGSEDKTVLDLVLGYSQVLSKTTVTQFGYSLTQSSGYHNDPFKIVSVIDTDNSNGNGVGQAERHLYENRPDSRAKHAVFARLKQWLFGKDVLDASYRFVTDDWGMSSHTLDVKYRFAFGSQYLQPRLRYYQQAAVDFYTPFLRDDMPVPTEFTADSRQGDFTALTYGLEYGYRFRSGSELQLSAEFYQQQFDEPANAPGQLASQDMVPDLDAVMFRVNYNFNWD